MNNDLSRKPFQLGPRIWCYEEPEGITLWTPEGGLGTIPWRKIKAALKRKEAQR